MAGDIQKTYKLFIRGGFPRSESGRTYQPAEASGHNVAMASRKDLRDAVVAARAAAPDWAGRTGYNRGQILFRLAEIVASRRRSLVDEIRAGNRKTAATADREVASAVELITFYAGLPDKLQQLLGSQNAVAGPYFNFSTVEPVGVVGAAPPAAPGLLGTLAVLLPLLAGGNTAVVLVSEPAPLPGLALGELLAVSDLPAGVVNLLAGRRAELVPQLAAHRDVDGLLLAGAPDAAVSKAAAGSVKRVRFADLGPAAYRRPERLCSLHFVQPFVETKTLWHPLSGLA